MTTLPPQVDNISTSLSSRAKLGGHSQTSPATLNTVHLGLLYQTDSF